MAVPTNYTELKADVATWLARTDLTSVIPNFITMGEAYLNRHLRLLQMETEASVTLSSSAETAALPTGWLENISLRFNDNSAKLNQISAAKLADHKSTSSGKPTEYIITSTFEFNRPADQAYTLKARYFKKWNITSDATNTLLTNAPDVYTFASMVEAGVYTRNQGMIGIWVPKRDEGIKWLNSLDARTRRNVKATLDPSLAAVSHFDIQGS